MKVLKGLFLALIALLSFSCLTFGEPEAAMELESVSWAELADKDMMEDNAGRYVEVEVQFLGPDVLAMPSQALYSAVSNVVLMNHIDLGMDYEDGVTTSLDSFLVGLPGTDATNDLMENGQFGDTIKIIGKTEFVNAGFGLFKHLLIRVESFENLGQ